jgi:beta-galactosidase
MNTNKLKYLKEMRLTTLVFTGLILSTLLTQAQKPVIHEFSTAGFFQVEGTGRVVQNFNVGWRFYLGNIDCAEQSTFNDKDWNVVSLPHGLELLPLEASGGKNYQGKAWYRKRFEIPADWASKKISLHFEGIMGKCKIWVDGVLLKENFAGYLPVILDLSKAGINPGKEHLIAVCADNSDDPMFPPGKPQAALDFCYFGGIYRDVWLIATNTVHITNPNAVDKVAGGGLFVHFPEVSEEKSVVAVETDMVNESTENKSITLETILRDAAGQISGKTSTKIQLAAGESKQIKQTISVPKAHLWHPNDPYLYKMYSNVLISGKVVDGFYTRVGIRKIEFRGKDGFFLNGKYFNDKLIGQNRHQDFAYLGNAIPNSLHWRDAKKLRDAHQRIIRSHYPHDPAFMDACDELGLFCIVSTVGWQFWNNDPIFAQRIYSDIRQAVRRDRNYASVILWEPILNETHYPEYFAEEAYKQVHKEYPNQGCFAACDINTPKWELFDVIYAHILKDEEYEKINKSILTREWGENVDDWSAHNSSSRTAREWGEVPQLVQALHYAKPSPLYTWASMDKMYQAPAAHVGGCMWHSFDHQRGYHPDPFWGGIMDAFRQPKYSYYMFKSQCPASIQNPAFECGYNIFIAHEMTPFSPADVTVFTNADEVRLIVNGKDTLIQKVDRSEHGTPNPPVIFKNVYDFMRLKELQRAKSLGTIVAEGLVNGKVVVSSTRVPGKKSERISLSLDTENQSFVANGSDVAVVIAAITDRDGTIRRLSKEELIFTVEGEATLITDAKNSSNPRKTEWGTAPILIRSTINAGKIKISVKSVYSNDYAPIPAILEIESVPSNMVLNYKEKPTIQAVQNNAQNTTNQNVIEFQEKLKKVTDELNKLRLKEVEKDQEIFENNKK